MVYCCEYCKYTTDNQSNWIRHQKSTRHILKVNCATNNSTNHPKPPINSKLEKELACEIKNENCSLVCDFCKSRFSKRFALTRHIKTCYIANKNENPASEIKKIMNMMEKLVEKTEKLSEENEQLKNEKIKSLELDKNKLFRMVDNAGTIVNKSMNVAQSSINALTYANKYFTDTPALEPVDDIEFIVPTNRTGSHNIIDISLSCDKSDKLAKYISDKLVDYYKKDNPTLQAIWTGDTSRMNYIVRKAQDIDGDKLCWTKDKNGEHIRKIVVGPILLSIDELLNGFIKGKTKQMNENIDDIDFVRQIIRELSIAGNLSRDISNKSIENEIIKTIAPPLFLDTTVKTIT